MQQEDALGARVDRVATAATTPTRAERVRAHVRICRVDHWFKNVFVLPGVVVAVSIVPHVDSGDLAWRLVVTLVAPPGMLGGHALEWPAPPPRRGADPPEWRNPS